MLDLKEVGFLDPDPRDQPKITKKTFSLLKPKSEGMKKFLDL